MNFIFAFKHMCAQLCFQYQWSVYVTDLCTITRRSVVGGFYKQNFRHKTKHWWKIYSLTVWLLKLLKNHLVIKELNFYLTTNYVCAIRALQYDRSAVLHSICKCGICYKVTFVKSIRKCDFVRCYLRLAVGVNVCIL